MANLFRSNRAAGHVAFCERCGSVCDASCRAVAAREAAHMQALLGAWRLA